MEFINILNKDKFTLVKDVIMHPLRINKDESGILVETLRTDWSDIYGKDREFAMQYYSITPSGAARDEKVWHYHPTVQEDRFLVIQGAIIVAVADQRVNSATKGLLNLFTMKSDEDPYILLIPKETLHGFLVISKEPAILLNFPTALYNPKEEGRVSYEEAKIKLPKGEMFSWDLVRKKFSGRDNL